MNDRDILLLLEQRDEAAVRYIQTAYGAYCKRIAANILGQGEDADECVNDVWLRLWNSIPPAKPRDLKLYIARTARNAAVNMLKRRTAEKRGGGEAPAALDELAEILPAEASSPEDAAMYEELKKSVNAFLHTLPERDCNVFLRRYFFADDTASIASLFRLKESHVRLILSRTRKKLREYLLTEGFIYE